MSYRSSSHPLRSSRPVRHAPSRPFLGVLSPLVFALLPLSVLLWVIPATAAVRAPAVAATA